MSRQDWFFIILILLGILTVGLIGNVTTSLENSTHEVSASNSTNISINDTNISTITVVGKPSVASDLPYKDFVRTWKNECPFCGAHNLLDNPKGVYEGEVTCGDCDADFCKVTGKDKNCREVYLEGI